MTGICKNSKIKFGLHKRQDFHDYVNMSCTVQVFWDVTLCLQVNLHFVVNQSKKPNILGLTDPEDGGNIISRNVGNYLLADTE